MRQTRLSAQIGKLGLLVLVGIIAGLSTGTADAAINLNRFTNTLTNPNDVSAAGNQGKIDLHLKNSKTIAEVPLNRMAAYYPNERASDANSTTGMKLKILGSRDVGRCKIPSKAKGYLRITITIKASVKRVVNIPIQKVCKGSNFYGREVAFPTGKLQEDRSGLYRAVIRVEFTGNALTPAQMGGDTDGWSLNYNMRLMGQRSSKGVLALLGQSAVTGSARDFGFRSSYVGRAGSISNKNVTAGVVYGYPCSADPSNLSVRERRVGVYDPDGVFGDTYLQIRENGNPLPKNAYDRAAEAGIRSWDNGRKAWLVDPGNDVWRYVAIKKNQVEANSTYKMTIVNTGKNSRASPHYNTLSLYIPYDSIFGAVDCSYTLKPKTALDRDRVEPGQKVTVTSTVDKNGAAPETVPTIWRVAKMVFPASANINALEQKTADFNDDGPCSVNAYKGSGRESCTVSWSTSPSSDRSGSRRYTFTNPSTFETLRYTATAADVGKVICFVTSVSDPRNPDNQKANESWRHSNNLQCVLVAKPPIKPMAQLWGYDGRFGGKAVTSLTSRDSETYGSWSEYGALSGGRNLNLASASGLSGGNSSDNQPSWSKLTFANTADPCGVSNNFGCYGAVGYPETMVEALRARCTRTFAGDTNITQALMSTHKIVCVNGTATVTGDISHGSGNTADPAGLPQFVLVADDILVENDVNSIDAWLIAASHDGTGGHGRISTCSAVHDGANYFPAFNDITLAKDDSCSEQLAVTGPVVADALYLYRTRNPGSSGAPAERFNLRADAFLWAYAGGSGDVSSVAQTVLIKEVPPRF